MSVKNHLGVMPEGLPSDSTKKLNGGAVGRPKGIPKTGGAVDRNKQLKEGFKNLMEVFPLGQSPKSLGLISIIHKKEW